MTMKNTPDIRELLDRYWVGETTLEEERRIKAFFAATHDDDLPEEFRQEARWFRILQSEQAVEAPDVRRTVLSARPTRWYGIAAAIVALLCAAGVWWRLSTSGPVEQVVQSRPMENIESPKPHELPVVTTPLKTPEPAQPFVAETKSYKPTRLKKQSPNPREDDTCDDPEQALAEIKAALALVSSKLNKSKETLDKGLQEVDHVDILLKRKNG